MTRHYVFSVGAAIFLAGSLPLSAQQTFTAIPETRELPDSALFSFEIGHASKPGATYTVRATQPSSSKLNGQKVRFKIVETIGVSRTTHFFTLATGKLKTVAQLDDALAEIFHRFLVMSPSTPGQDLGKVGDLQHGGEVHFVVGSADDLHFESLTPNAPARTSHYTRSDIEMLRAALTGLPPG